MYNKKETQNRKIKHAYTHTMPWSYGNQYLSWFQRLLITPTTSLHPRPLETWVWRSQCGWASSFLPASVLPLSQAEKMVLGRLDGFSKPEVRPLPATLVSPIIPSRLPWAESWSLDSHFIYTYFSSGDPWVERTWVTFSPEARSLPGPAHPPT